MNAATFNKLLAIRLRAISESLESKAGEYATGDRLYNFKEAANTFGGTPTEVCWSYMLKHLVSIKDLATGVRPGDPTVVHEKIGDAINYLILMEALLLEGVIDDVLDRDEERRAIEEVNRTETRRLRETGGAVPPEWLPTDGGGVRDDTGEAPTPP